VTGRMPPPCSKLTVIELWKSMPSLACTRYMAMLPVWAAAVVEVGYSWAVKPLSGLVK
jgi:hypothetical protein